MNLKLIVKYRKAIYAFFVIIAFIASLVILTGRIKIENASRTVELTFDYNDLEELCKEESITIDEGLERFKEAGVTSIALPETTIDQLQNRNRLRYADGAQLSVLLNFSGKDASSIKPDAVYLFDYDAATGRMINKNLAILWASDSFVEKEIPSPTGEMIKVLEVRGKPREVPFLGIGFDKLIMEKIRQKDLFIVLRPENRPNLDPKIIENYLTSLGTLNGVTTFVFGGQNEVMGYPAALPSAVEGILKTNTAFGDIEAPNPRAKQKGAQFLAQRLFDRTVRVQSITPQYLSKLTPEDAIDKFRLGVRERNIRMIYLRPYPRGINDDDLLTTNLKYVSNLKNEISRFKFKTGAAARFPATSPPPILVLLIALGAGGAFMLLLDYFYFDKGAVGLVVMLSALIFSAILIFTGKMHLVQKIVGLLIGVTFPVYAFASRFEEMEVLETHNKLSKVIGYGVSTFIKITLVTILGGLMIAALFSSTPFMLSIDQFRGIKVLLLLPPLLTTLLYYLKGTKERHSLKSIMSKPLYMWQTVVAGILGAMGLLYLQRSGNASESAASGFEITMRVMLEKVMWVRPRFKDFTIGHPSMILLWGLSYLHKYGGLGIFVILAAIGQADIVDTFAHIHTPVFISLVRVINGAILGGIIGTLALAFYWFILGKKKAAE